MSINTFWLKVGLFSVGLGQSFAFVLIPPLARDLGLTEIQTSTIFAISAIAWAMTSAGWGRASDSYGRRNIAIIGLFGYSISIIALFIPLLLVQQNLLSITLLFPLLILGRLINGIIGSATRPAMFGYMADNSDKTERTFRFAQLESSFLIGTVVGPLIGGLLFLVSEGLPFYIFSMCGFISCIGIYLNIPNEKIINSNKSKKNLSFTDNSVWPFLFLASILSLCHSSLLQSIGFYITDMYIVSNLPLFISVCYAVLSMSTIVSQFLFTDYLRLSNTSLLRFGIFIVLVSYVFAGLSSTIWYFYFSIILNGVGFGMIRPANASALSLAQDPENQGSAAGYLGSVIPIGHMLTPIIAMPIYQFNPSFLYYFSSILCFVAAIFIILNPMIKSMKFYENEI